MGTDTVGLFEPSNPQGGKPHPPGLEWLVLALEPNVSPIVYNFHFVGPSARRGVSGCPTADGYARPFRIDVGGG